MINRGKNEMIQIWRAKHTLLFVNSNLDREKEQGEDHILYSTRKLVILTH